MIRSLFSFIYQFILWIYYERELSFLQNRIYDNLLLKRVKKKNTYILAMLTDKFVLLSYDNSHFQLRKVK